MIDTKEIKELSKNGRIFVAYSGGGDSTTLLHYLYLSGLKNIYAIHVNHNISANSKTWERLCLNFCKDLDIPIFIERINLQSSSNLEEEARNKRYEIFESYLTNENDILVMGHHKNDQVETVLLRLFRGSGVTGVSGIPKIRKLGKGFLYRPLLSVSRQEIDNYVKDNNLNYVSDESNLDDDFDRNFIRNQIIPVLEERFPALCQNIFKSSELFKQANEAIFEQSNKDLINCLIGNGKILNIDSLKKYSSFQQTNILRYWITTIFNVKYPSKDKIDSILELIDLDVSINTKKLVHISNKLIIRRHKNHIYAVEQYKYDTSNTNQYPFNQYMISFNFGNILPIKSNNKGNLKKGDYILKFRPIIGNKNYIVIKNKIVKLKKILQEENIPYWLKDYIPLIYNSQNELVAIITDNKTIISDEWSTQNDEEGYEIKWNFT